MKNILIYTNPAEEFNQENQTLVKIHIDNSLELGWSKEDILLFTNFHYQYNGIQSRIIPLIDCRWDRTSNKIFVIEYLLKNKKIEDNLYWYHDFDAYQNSPFSAEDLDMKNFDLGLTGYGYKPQWNGGSFFFKETAIDLFELWCRETKKVKRTRADEKTMTDMTRSGLMKKNRYKAFNITYNFGMRHTHINYAQADKPLKVLHFHPHYYESTLPFPTKQIFMYGKNPMGFPLMSDRLIKIFHKHGIK